MRGEILFGGHGREANTHMIDYHTWAVALKYRLRQRPDSQSRVDAVAGFLRELVEDSKPKLPRVVHCRKGRDKSIYQTVCKLCAREVSGPGDALLCRCGARLHIEFKRPGLRINGKVVEQKW